MATNTRLSDLQLVLLSHAAQRDDGSMYPLPEAGTRDEPRTAKELKSLVRRKLIDEVEVTDGAQSWRADGDQCFGLALTEAGREALGLGAETENARPAEPTEANASAAPREGSKIARVIAICDLGGLMMADRNADVALLEGYQGGIAPCSPSMLSRLLCLKRSVSAP